MAKRRIQPIGTYVNEQGYTVTVYPEKKAKHPLWQRGEAYLGIKMRIPEDLGAMMAPFTRKNGKY